MIYFWDYVCSNWRRLNAMLQRVRRQRCRRCWKCRKTIDCDDAWRRFNADEMSEPSRLSNWFDRCQMVMDYMTSDHARLEPVNVGDMSRVLIEDGSRYDSLIRGAMHWCGFCFVDVDRESWCSFCWCRTRKLFSEEIDVFSPDSWWCFWSPRRRSTYNWSALHGFTIAGMQCLWVIRRLFRAMRKCGLNAFLLNRNNVDKLECHTAVLSARHRMSIEG